MQVLAPGNGYPPLTNEMAGVVAALYGWTESVVFNNDELGTLVRALVSGWQQGQRQCVEAVLQCIDIATSVDTSLLQDATQEDTLRRQCREWFIERSMDLASTFAQWLLSSPGTRPDDRGDRDALDKHAFALSSQLLSESLHWRRMRDLHRDW